MIDACEYCGTFQRVTIENVTEDGDAQVICSDCLKMRWNECEDLEKPEKVNYKKYKWKEVSSV